MSKIGFWTWLCRGICHIPKETIKLLKVPFVEMVSGGMLMIGSILLTPIHILFFCAFPIALLISLHGTFREFEEDC